ncbi:protein ARABIDILLO 1-like [Bidens hawaiensis]|uniref:protein ARABIDILLO 1-like n=1 Tax=Bidens hawaiensis TaxID=980011 RepID=UPI00404A0747
MIFASLAKSRNRWVAEEAAFGLQNLAEWDEHKGAIAESGAIITLVDLIFKWPRGGDELMERAAGALAHMASNDKCAIEVAAVGGIKALVMLARVSKDERVQVQVAAALANLTAYGDSNTLNAAVGQEDGAIDALVLLIRSENEAVCQEALSALSNLLSDDRNLEQIVLVEGVEALVSLARRCTTSANAYLQKIVARTLWTLSASEANSITIGREGGVTALIRLARSTTEDVEEAAAEALLRLTFNPRNALRIVEDGSVLDLYKLKSCESEKARFMIALVCAYMCDGRMDEYARVAEGAPNSSDLEMAKIAASSYISPVFMWTFVDRRAFSGISLSTASAQVAQIVKSAHIAEACDLRCNQAEIERILSMLRNKRPALKSCAAFALFQFTVPGGRYAREHVNLLRDLGALRVLRHAAAAAAGSLEAKIFSKLVLRNLEHQDTESSA